MAQQPRRVWTDENGDVWPDCIGIGTVTTVSGKDRPKKKREPIGFVHFSANSPSKQKRRKRKA